MGEVVGVDGRVDGGIGRCDMYAATREGVFEDSEHGEVVAWVEDWVRAEEETGVIGISGRCTAGKVDFLQAGFLGIEEFLEDERIFL